MEVEPAMFEDVSDEELAKYDKFLKEMDEIEQKQNSILSEIQVRSESQSSWPILNPRMNSVAMNCFCSPGRTTLPSKNGNMLCSPLI